MKRELSHPLLHLPLSLCMSTSSASSRPLEPPACPAGVAVTQAGWRNRLVAPSPEASQRASYPARHGGGLPAARAMTNPLPCLETSWCIAASGDDSGSLSPAPRLPELPNNSEKLKY